MLTAKTLRRKEFELFFLAPLRLGGKENLLNN